MKIKFFDFKFMISDNNYIEAKDIIILNEILQNNKLGTLELSKNISLAPKNLIKRIKKLESEKLILKKIIPAKPKGRLKILEITDKGKLLLILLDSKLNNGDLLIEVTEENGR